MEELLESIENCEKLLYQGFVSAKSFNAKWLNKCTNCLGQLFKMIELGFRAKGRAFAGSIALCTSQILVAVKYLELTLNLEQTSESVLGTSRKLFLDRLLTCLEKIRETCIQAESLEEDSDPSLMSLFDSALEILAPYCHFESDNRNELEENADFSKVKSLIDCIVLKTLDFNNVLDRKDPLSCLCQKVLHDYKELQEASGRIDSQLKAICLETSICALEKVINESLLVLMFKAFGGLRKVSLRTLREDQDDSMQDLVDQSLDSLLHIGTFAMSFATDFKVSVAIKSCLASLEFLESVLSAEFLSKLADLDFELIEDHWKDETQRLERNIQVIIETSAFCGAFLGILEEKVGVEEKPALEEIMLSAEVLNHHFVRNFEPGRKEIDDFGTMIKECRAGLQMMESVDPKRVVKRFKVLKTVVRRVKESLEEPEVDENKPNEEVLKKVIEETLKTPHFAKVLDEKSFKKPQKSILYQSARRKRVSAHETVKETAARIVRDSTPKKALTRKMSLRRVAMFKAKNFSEDLHLHAADDQSLTLHISQILNDLKNVTAHRDPEIQVLGNHKIRIHVIGDI